MTCSFIGTRTWCDWTGKPYVYFFIAKPKCVRLDGACVVTGRCER